MPIITKTARERAAHRGVIDQQLEQARRQRVNAGERHDAHDAEFYSQKEEELRAELAALDRLDLAELRGAARAVVDGKAEVSSLVVALGDPPPSPQRPANKPDEVFDILKRFWNGDGITNEQSQTLADFFMLKKREREERKQADVSEPSDVRRDVMTALLRRGIYFGHLLTRTGDKTAEGWIKDATETVLRRQHNRDTTVMPVGFPTLFSLLERGLYIAELLRATGDKTPEHWCEEVKQTLWPSDKPTARESDVADAAHVGRDVWCSVFGAAYVMHAASSTNYDAAAGAAKMADAAIEALARVPVTKLHPEGV